MFLDSAVYAIGSKGHILSFCITILSIQNQPFFLYAYLLAFIANEVLNKILKYLIKQKRPYGHSIHLETSDMGIEQYGMPSGHAQSTFFSLVFAWLVTGSKKLFLTEFLVCCMSIFQRYMQKKHTLEQLAVGTLVGIGGAYGVYSITEYIQYHLATRTSAWKSAF